MARDDKSWIQTVTGRQVWPLDPEPGDFCIEDIAHALALVNRFTGHTIVPYSVAQHSVIVSRIVPAADALAALLHDASEAYLLDMARPLKAAMPDYQLAERRLMEAIAARFGFALPLPDSVHRADLVLLATERRDLMATPPRPWITTANVEPLADEIYAWGWQEAKAKFLHRFEQVSRQ